jgi:hypothetical protein
MLKTGEPNPLGGADLSYAERVEYTSVATLKDKLRALLISKSTAARKTKEVAYHIYDGGKPLNHDQLQAHTLTVLKAVYREKRINKQQAETIFGDRAFADAAINKLRELDILKMESQRRGAIYVFSDKWVYHDHEVTGA